ncbi:MAG: GGDEF domain-containing protein [Phycisphaerae bacterium]|nr:GGDEF domain-containing protein [Phycisphaerae bacterium]
MTPDPLIPTREQLLIVHDPGNLAAFVRGRYPQFEVATASSYMEGLVALARQSPRGVLVGVDPTARKLGSAIAGLRKAAGPGSRIVLCCMPSGEPAARRVVAAGADDYLVYPPDGGDLDAALALTTPGGPSRLTASAPPIPTWDELHSLTDILAGLADGQTAMLERLCRLLADTMRTPFVRITLDQDSRHVGDPKTEPALFETIESGGSVLGRIEVGPRHRSPFSAAEVERLRHHSRLIAHLLKAAEQQQQWHRLAMIDEVTQLPNRRYFKQALETLIRRAATERFSVTVVIFDLDGFKHFNDTYGHNAGDQVLRELAQLIRRHCRRHDIVARYAGDEFVVAFWDAEEPRVAGSKHPTDALAVLRRFQKTLESQEYANIGSDSKGRITISGGLATFPWDAQESALLIERADQAMLRAKRDGKNRIYLVGGQTNSEDERG